MRILALDSSGLVASVALVEGDSKEGQTIAEYTVNYDPRVIAPGAKQAENGRIPKNRKTHSQTLLPMLDAMMKMAEIELDTIDAIAVAGGPGSFTGLRIGSATAKGLGLALDKPLIHIPTLEGLAYNMCQAEGVICPIMDARRGQVYTGIYEFDGSDLVILEDQMAVSIEELGNRLRKYKKKITFLGDGVPVFKKELQEKILADCEISFAPANMSRQRAASVGALALRYYEEGRTETAAAHQPDYLRMSQAERERQEKEHADKKD